MYTLDSALKAYGIRPTPKQMAEIENNVLRISFRPDFSRQAGVPVHGHLTDGHFRKIYRTAIKGVIFP